MLNLRVLPGIFLTSTKHTFRGGDQRIRPKAIFLADRMH